MLTRMNRVMTIPDMDIIDFHAHILPRADHGSSSTEVSITQINLAKAVGINRIVATPHFYPQQENLDTFISRRNSSYRRLKERFTEDYPEIKLGAEVLICDNIEQMPMLESLCIEGTKVLLIELPFLDFFDSYVYSVKSLVQSGYTVVIAHADRYNPTDIEKLIRAGAYLQLNADSLCRWIIPKHLKKWLNHRSVVALGSDIHGSDKKAYLRFKKAIKAIGDNITYIKDFSDSIWNYQ